MVKQNMCYYCKFTSPDLQTCINHIVDLHGHLQLKLRTRTINESTGKCGLLSKDFGVIPNLELQYGQYFKVDATTFKLEIQNRSDEDDIDILQESIQNLSLDIEADATVRSPFTKVHKTSTPLKGYDTVPLVGTSEEADTLSYDKHDVNLEEMKTLLPIVIDEMKKSGHLKPWMDFHRMVGNGKFPIDNIAFQLFMDVCRFYACDNTSELTYSDAVKRFWRIGYRLFHGKWLKFMSGPKHTGKLITKESDRGQFIPEEGSINFAVPLKSVTSLKSSPVSPSELEPGIINYLLDKVSDNSNSQKTYKLCLDGKKINASTSGKYGDIDLWGYEHTPTLSERKASLESDRVSIESVSKFIHGLIDSTKTSTKDMTLEEKDTLRNHLLNIVFLLSRRIKSLRQMMVSKETSQDKLMLQSGTDWKKSKLAFVISAIITSIYDIKACICNLLKIIDQACNIIASFNGSKYITDNVVNISELSNYKHLVGESSQPRFVKQRSEQWFDIRKKAIVTGSTIYDAIGLRTLKQQNRHFDEVISNIKKPEPSDQVKEMMRHGTESEIHAVATFAGKVLPVLSPELTLYEEGCYPFTVNDVPIVVSPDGSCRSGINESAKFGVEIKCPYPGKKYTTPVTYTMPKHYVPQVLSEMKALGTDKLYFICYSYESSTVHEVDFDEHVWNLIEQEICFIYGSAKPSRPTRKSVNVALIQEKLSSFVEKNTRLLFEIPSLKAIDCIETNGNDALFCTKHYDSTVKRDETNFDMSHVHEILYNADLNLNRAYQLSRHKASEFLGFMISDLDRNYHIDMLHSVPIAYGLKGYSLPTSTLRTMIEVVLKECSNRGLYVPVCSFDGQWCRLVIRDRKDQPLTVFQLQKDVYTEARQTTKTDLVKRIALSNIVEAKSLDELQQSVNVEWKTRYNEETREIEKYIQVGKMKSGYVYSISKETFNIIQRNDNVMPTEIPETLTNGTENGVLNTVQDEVLDKISPELVNDFNELAAESEINRLNHSHESIYSNSELKEPENQVIENSETVQTLQNEATNQDTASMQSKDILDDDDYTSMLSALTDDSRSKNSEKWKISSEEFKAKFATAETMSKSFFAYELNICVKKILGKLRAAGIKLNLSANKCVMVNTLSKVIGDGSTVESKARGRKKVPLLKSLAKTALKKLKKEYLNIIEAENKFPSRLSEWYADNPFGKYIDIASLDCSDQCSWYSRPEMNEEIGHYIFMILDAYHQLCSARRLFCLKGIPEAGIYNSSVRQIAEESEQNKCGLRTAMVQEPMLDRQSVAYAVATFSEEVQRALIEIGANEEAYFCELIRNWYKAEDEPGISSKDRCLSRLKLRKWLLKNVNFGKFPPGGAYVKDIPIVLFEGLLTGIERRIQLFPFTKSGSYNVRSIGSLDIENFFGGFQDIDPWGTGVLRPDSIATALSVAVELTETKMNPERGFHMMTSSAKVYPVNTYEKMDIDQLEGTQEVQNCLRDVSHINIKDHMFDTSERRRGKRKRKLGNISKPEEPVRRPTTVREFHRAHEAKLLPHVRRGLNLES